MTDRGTGHRPTFVIRTADGDDLDGVVAVGRAAWTTTHSSLYPPELRDLFIAKWWTTDANVHSILAGRTFVAEADGRIVGMASYGTDKGRLIVWKIYVLDEYQGMGVGSGLMDAVCERAVDDHDAVYVGITDGNDAGLAFATAEGFVVDHREEQSGMPDLIWLRRDFDRTKEAR